MAKTLRTAAHDAFLEQLRLARKKAGMTQQYVADALGRPQSFVAKYEGGERRLDVIEFLEVANALDADYRRILREVARNL